MSIENRATAGWARHCYGVDATPGGMRVVKARCRGRQLDVETVDYTPGMLADLDESKSVVVAALPVALGIATRLQAPFASVSKSEKVLPTLLDVQLPFSLDDCLYRFVDVKRDGDATTALALAARKPDIDNRLAFLKDRGIVPHVLDYEGVALWTGLLRELAVRTDDDKIRVIMFLRGDEGVLAIGRGREFRACHRINTASPASIDRYLRAQFNRMAVGIDNARGMVEWYWAGEGYAPGERGTAMQSHVAEIWHGENRMLAEPEYFLARALAERALLDGPLRVNLLTAEYAHPGVKLVEDKSCRNTALTVLMAGLVMIGASLGWQYWMASRSQAVEKAFASRIQRLLGYKVKARGRQAMIIAQRELASRNKAYQPLMAVLEPSLLVDLQRVVAAAGKSGVKLEQLELSQDGMTLDVVADSGSVDAFTRDMRESGYAVKLTRDSGDLRRYKVEISSARDGQPQDAGKQ